MQLIVGIGQCVAWCAYSLYLRPVAGYQITLLGVTELGNTVRESFRRFLRSGAPAGSRTRDNENAARRCTRRLPLLPFSASMILFLTISLYITKADIPNSQNVAAPPVDAIIRMCTYKMGTRNPFLAWCSARL